MPFLVAGDPSLEATQGAIIAMDDANADIIEIGIPFSDPRIWDAERSSILSAP